MSKNSRFLSFLTRFCVKAHAMSSGLAPARQVLALGFAMSLLTGSLFGGSGPSISTWAPYSITTTGATLFGTVYPMGSVFNASFEYGLTTAYGTSVSVPENPIAGDFFAHPLSYAVSGLSPNTTYHCRLYGVYSGGTVYGWDMTFTTLSVAPTVSSISPNSGPTAGGTAVTLTGANFLGGATVKFGSTSATSVTVNSATQVVATAPAGSAGTVDVTITTANGTSATSASDQFTYADPPVISSGSTASGAYRAVYTSVSPLYTIEASNTPTSYSVTGTLPGGISVNTTTGILSGTPTDAGTFNVTVRATNAGGTGSAALLLTIAKATPSITWPTPAAILYGAALSATQLNASASVAGSYVYTPTTGTVLGVGPNQTLNVSFTPFDAANYNGATGSTTLTVNQVNQAITFPTLGNKTYGDASFAVSATADSNLPVAFSVLSGPATLTGNTVTITGAGTVRIRAAQAGNATYAAAPLVDRSFTVAASTVTPGITASGKTYDGTTAATIAGRSLTGRIGTDDVSLSGGTATFDTRNVGTGKTVTATGLALSGAQAGNYQLASATATATANIAAKVLSVAGLNASDKSYDGTTAATLTGTAALLATEPAGTGTTADGKPYTGDTVSVTGTPVGSFATAATGPAKSVTVSGLSLAGTEKDNYSLSAPTLTASITQATPTITWATPEAITYGTPLSARDLNATASFGGSPVAGTLVYSPVAGTVLGAGAGQTLNVTFTPTDTASYTTATATTTLTVNKAALTVRADNKTKVYGEANPALTCTITGFVNAENATTAGVTGVASVTCPATTASGVGTYTITPAAGTLSVGNYSIGSLVNGTLTISQATATITLGTLGFTFDGQPKSTSASTVPAGLPVAITYDGSTSAPVNVGTYTVNAALTDPNYAGSISGTLGIVKANQTIQFAPLGTTTIGAPVPLSATTSSALPIAFSVVSGNATLNGNSLTVADSGTVVVRATQAGNGNYNPASVDQSISGAAKLAQTIAFAQPADQRATAAPITLVATASSGLPVTFTLASGPALLSGNTLTLGGTSGAVTLRASQAGNAIYSAAPDVTRTFTVSPVGPQVFFGATGTGDALAANIGSDNTQGTLIGFLRNTNEGFVVNFTLDASGNFTATVATFTGTAGSSGATDTEPRVAADQAIPSMTAQATAAAAATRTFTGRVANGVISGSIVELALSFSAAVQPWFGPTATLAGYYTAASTNTATGSIYSVVGTQGTVYTLVVTPGLVAGSNGVVDTKGNFTVQTPVSGASITGTVDAPSTTVTGTVTSPNQGTQSFAGLNSTTVRTDRLVNFSSRVWVGDPAGNGGVLITGFVIGGTAPKQFLLRAIGPSLATYGIRGALPNPSLRLFDARGRLLMENDDWSGADLAAAMARVGAFALPNGSKDSALLVTLDPGLYTMQVVGNGGQGVALAEIYDAGMNPQAEYQRLVNISTLGTVTAGEGVLVGGFIVSGNSPKKVLIRGIGPGLARFGLSGTLADPVLTVTDSAGRVVARNDNWEAGVPLTAAQTSATPAELQAAFVQTGAFELAAGSKDAALLVTLPPGTYSAQVTGAAGTTGVALNEIYELPADN
jgi:hypothetical protein